MAEISLLGLSCKLSEEFKPSNFLLRSQVFKYHSLFACVWGFMQPRKLSYKKNNAQVQFKVVFKVGKLKEGVKVGKNEKKKRKR